LLGGGEGGSSPSPLTYFVVNGALWDMGTYNRGIRAFHSSASRLVRDSLARLPPRTELVWVLLHALHPQRAKPSSKKGDQKGIYCNQPERQHMFRNAQRAATMCAARCPTTDNNAATASVLDTWAITASRSPEQPGVKLLDEGLERSPPLNASAASFSSSSASSSVEYASLHSPDGAHFDHALTALESLMLLQRMCHTWLEENSNDDVKSSRSTTADAPLSSTSAATVVPFPSGSLNASEIDDQCATSPSGQPLSSPLVATLSAWLTQSHDLVCPSAACSDGSASGSELQQQQLTLRLLDCIDERHTSSTQCPREFSGRAKRPGKE
jgi:hypothetical protein